MSPSCYIVCSILYQGWGTYPSFHIPSVFQSWKFCKFSGFFLFCFLLIIIRSGLLAEIRWSVCMSEFHTSLCVSFSRTGSGLYIYHLLVWSSLNLLHISQWITLYFFCANLLHSLMRLIVSSPSSHSLHLLFCWVLSILADLNNAVVWMIFTYPLISRCISLFY